MVDANTILGRALGGEHEQVVLCHDADSGLQAVIAIYSTALGPALGGTRFYPYASQSDALSDALNLSKGMAYKAALAGLDLGGGKAVIIGDPSRDKSEALLRAYGRFVETLGGRYYTACDVGTYSPDMDVVSRETAYATGRTEENGGSGDSSILTAVGVFHGMRATAQHVWGNDSLEGRKVGIVGVGKVGKHLTKLLLEAGAFVVVTDVSSKALASLTTLHPTAQVVSSEQELVRSNLDIYAPCALGGSVNDDLVPELASKIICGAANNQLAHPGIETRLSELGITYAPDYCVNAGGVIQVAEELTNFNFKRARTRTVQTYDRTLKVLTSAVENGISTTAAADRIAERRINEISRLRRIRVAGRQLNGPSGGRPAA
ncbi:Glu/Leu/Phe/Val dehydrogenase dimerization domain-containing protein [Dactylosporangium sp. CA-233914]|uniref:Glu/Leu/Phe/Val dehydrogenase dimerization domain-containing protein n=1 Tax=Dactylosporangium sp. CA-233914 TaxID=3239934 RepID=UPI003D92C70A